jgi:hypothetical protein
MISQHNIKFGSLTLVKISSFLQLVKADLGLKIQGVHSILCECAQVYVGRQAI